MAYQPEAAVEVLRAVWAAKDGDPPDLTEGSGPTKNCKNMKDVSFAGLAEAGTDLGRAWRERLRREGKLRATGGSLRELVLNPRRAS